MSSSKVIVLSSKPFSRAAKRLRKKYHSLPDEIEALIKTLEKNPQSGEPLGKNAYKIRLKVKSKGGGKSGGLRVITAVYMKTTPKEVYLMLIFDKAERDNITDKQLAELLKQVNPVK